MSLTSVLIIAVKLEKQLENIFKNTWLKKYYATCFFTTFIYTQPRSEDYLRVGAEIMFFSYIIID